MEEAIEIDMDATLAEVIRRRKGKKKNAQQDSKAKDMIDDTPPGRIEVSLFDYSVENHFKAMDTISKLCAESAFQFDQCEIQRLSSSITFLREWRHFNYQPRIIRFASQSESSQGKDVMGEISLPQFSSATVPKKDEQCGNTILSQYRKDFVMYVGGLVWALDWRPIIHQKSDSDIKSEFVAVAAHPPESSYHKIGAPLTGRGLIQIWCLLNFSSKEENVSSQVKTKHEGNPKNDKSTEPKKRRGRPRKTLAPESADNLDIGQEHAEAVAILIPEDSLALTPDGRSFEQVVTGYSARKRRSSGQVVSAEAKENPINNEIIDVKSPEMKKKRGRPKKKPRDEAKVQPVQALAVQFPEDSSSLIPVDEVSVSHPEQVSIRESGIDSCQVETVDPKQSPTDYETMQARSPQLKKRRGQPKAKSRDATEDQYLQSLAVQFPENCSTLLPINEISGMIHEHVAKRGSGRNKKKSSYGTAIEILNHSNNGAESPKAKKRRGKSQRELSNDPEDQSLQLLNVQSPNNFSSLLPVNEVSGDANELVAEKESSRRQIDSRLGVNEDPSTPRIVKNKRQSKIYSRRNNPHLLSKHGNADSPLENLEVPSCCGEDPVESLPENVTRNVPLEMNSSRCSNHMDVLLPRVVLCLAHNGKVAWDTKWQPSDSYDANSKHRLGYLAVLLGNGALEVWEVPSPQAIKVIYCTKRKDGIDPRFVKLDPVFRCSMLKCGDRQSMPQTLEWSASPPHDLILAGCHDGVVALWKFVANGSSKDTRPLICFSADTAPIRALAWAPVRDPESANVILTAGHKGMKFWDIRDPFRPLWDLNPVQRVICSLDWLPDPRCVVVSYDDGTIRILSLSKAASDVPITGRPFTGTQQQGLHSYYCSSYTIWSIQVSRLTGMVAYCSADGTALHFQLTTRAVERDPLRNRAPHFLCGSLTEEESTLTMYTPSPNIPFPMKKSLNEWANAPRTIRGFLSVSNQEKRAKEEMARGTSNQQPVALCYGDGPQVESGSDHLVEEKSKKASKTKTNSKKKLNIDQALVCREDDPEPIQRENIEKEEVADEVEVLPPKIIAMHKVRWNMNKGSERWLCYGGASGILRCQEINLCNL